MVTNFNINNKNLMLQKWNIKLDWENISLKNRHLLKKLFAVTVCQHRFFVYTIQALKLKGSTDFPMNFKQDNKTNFEPKIKIWEKNSRELLSKSIFL